jgi:ribonuclease HI
MNGKNTRHYVVWKGVRPGIYPTWQEASEQVLGYSGARLKRYGCLEDAEAAFHPHSPLDLTAPSDVVVPALAVDSSCRGAPGPLEYRGVWLTGEPYFQSGPYEDGTNNVGEFLAVVHAAALLKRDERSDVAIYSDSVTALRWVGEKTCQVKLTPRNAQILELVSRALIWLEANHIENPLLKWHTEHWGEIPADFGRK